MSLFKRTKTDLEITWLGLIPENDGPLRKNPYESMDDDRDDDETRTDGGSS